MCTYFNMAHITILLYVLFSEQGMHGLNISHMGPTSYSTWGLQENRFLVIFQEIQLVGPTVGCYCSCISGVWGNHKTVLVPGIKYVHVAVYW